MRIGWYLGFHLTHEHYPILYFGDLLTHPPFPIAFPFVIAAVGAWMMRHGRVLRGLALLAGSLVASAIIFPGLERVGGGWPLPVYSLSPLARWPEFRSFEKAPRSGCECRMARPHPAPRSVMAVGRPLARGRLVQIEAGDDRAVVTTAGQ